MDDKPIGNPTSGTIYPTGYTNPDGEKGYFYVATKDYDPLKLFGEPPGPKQDIREAKEQLSGADLFEAHLCAQLYLPPRKESIQFICSNRHIDKKKLYKYLDALQIPRRRKSRKPRE